MEKLCINRYAISYKEYHSNLKKCGDREFTLLLHLLHTFTLFNLYTKYDWKSSPIV